MGRKPRCWVCSVGDFQLRKDSWGANSAAGDFQEEGDSSRGSSVLTLTGCPRQTASPSGAWLKWISQNHHMSLPTLSSQASTLGGRTPVSLREKDSAEYGGLGPRRAANPNSPDITGS